MPSVKTEPLVKRFIRAAASYGAATRRLDTRAANRAAKTLLKLQKELPGQGEPGIRALRALLSHRNPWVRLWVSGALLPLGDRSAVAELERLAKSTGELGAYAEMALLARSPRKDK
jgi:hypothetical protein